MEEMRPGIEANEYHAIKCPTPIYTHGARVGRTRLFCTAVGAGHIKSFCSMATSVPDLKGCGGNLMKYSVWVV